MRSVMFMQVNLRMERLMSIGAVAGFSVTVLPRCVFLNVQARIARERAPTAFPDPNRF